MEGNLGILQKIPLRSYVGIEPSSPGEVRIGSYRYYSPGDRQFLSGFIEEPNATKLMTILKELPEIKKAGIILHIISEIPPSRGLNSSGAGSVALATALSMFWRKINPKEVETWQYMPTSKLLQNESFHKTLIKAWKFESIAHGDLTSGCTVLVPMIGGDYPIVCFPPHHDLDKIDHHWQTRYADLEVKKLTGTRMNELFKFNALPVWSFDFGLIYSGDVRPTSAVIQTSVARRQEINEILKDSKHLDLPKPYVFPQTHSWLPYMDALKISSLEILLNFREVFEKGLSEKAMRGFFLSVNRYQDLLNVIISHSAAIEAIENRLKQTLFGYRDEFGVGTKISGGGLKGDVLFVTAYHGIRDNLGKILDELGKEFSLNISLDYASWLDGIEDDAVIIEQDLSAKIYSSFISPGCTFVKHYSSSGYTHTDLYTPEEFERQKGMMSLLLDPIQNEIWIRKILLDSKVIPTSTATIKILKILLENLDKDVKNEKFPNSSYASDRNEFQSKIISPLTKAVRKHLKKEFGTQIHGSLDEFTVKLNQLPFSVHIIEKAF